MQPRESIERLSGIIGALEQLFPNDPLLAYELRDLLWLTPRVGPRRNAQAPAPPAEPGYSEAHAALPEPTGGGDPASPTASRRAEPVGRRGSGIADRFSGARRGGVRPKRAALARL